MIPFISLPVKIVRLFTSNISTSEIAAGVCIGLVMGFTPMNGPMAILLVVMLFTFKINRLSAILVLPLFKLLYVLGVSRLADMAGGILLINIDFLLPFWRIVTHLPVLALLDLNNTLVAGGLAISLLLIFPIYIFSQKAVVVLRKKYFDKIKNSKFVKWFMKIPIINKIASLSAKIKGEA